MKQDRRFLKFPDVSSAEMIYRNVVFYSLKQLLLKLYVQGGRLPWARAIQHGAS